jgi:hypothetical protein
MVRWLQLSDLLAKSRRGEGRGEAVGGGAVGGGEESVLMKAGSAQDFSAESGAEKKRMAEK